MGDIFEVVAAFLERSSRELSSASEAYSDYVVEGLQQCLRNLGYIQNSISTPYNIRFSRLEVATNIDELLYFRARTKFYTRNS